MIRLAIPLTAALALFLSPMAMAQEWDGPEASRTDIEQLVDAWYVEQCAGLEGRSYSLMAPGGFNASPGYRHEDTRAAVAGPVYATSLAATAGLFRYEIWRVRTDERFARVDVRERGYTYAAAAGATYEVMGDTLLVLERGEGGEWSVLAHQTERMGFPASLATSPLPDLTPTGAAFEHRCARYQPDEFAVSPVD